MISTAHSSTQKSGLSHLVDAATALTKLNEVASPEASAEPLSMDLQQVVSDDDSQGKRLSRPTMTSREIFPQRLMAVLSDPSVSDVISWLPHGRSFVIIRPDLLSERVLTKYFASTDPRSSTKYPSFTRKLNRWGFRQATRGSDMGAFHHPLFRRDQPELCLDMVCQKSRKPKANKSSEPKKADSPSSLPPKKRKMESDKKDPPTTAVPTNLNHHRVVSDSSLSNASSDDQSETSAPAPASVPQTLLNIPLLATLASLPMPLAAAATAAPAPAAAAATSTPIVINDANLVAAALKARENQERLSAAKAMLFNAYVNALNGQ